MIPSPPVTRGPGLTRSVLHGQRIQDTVRAYIKNDEYDPTSPRVIGAAAKRARRRARNLRLMNR